MFCVYVLMIINYQNKSYKKKNLSTIYLSRTKKINTLSACNSLPYNLSRDGREFFEYG